MFHALLLLLFLSGGTLAQITQPLPDDLDIDPNLISVSGISAGAAFASQMHVAYSSEVMGCAMFAGPPYYCAEGSLSFALGRCMATPGNVPVDTLVSATEDFASAGKIDSTTGVQGDKVFVWSGAYDDVVLNGIVLKNKEYYEALGADVVTSCPTDLGAGHGQPIYDHPDGNSCESSSSPYLNNCQYDGAFEGLNWIYGNLTRPDRSRTALEDPILFDQTEFFFNPGSISMDTAGYVYVPPQCVGGQTRCGLHIAFHGCLMFRDGINGIGDTYVVGGGYNEVGDENDLVMLYPGTISSFSIPYNPNGCFDWWGYNDDGLSDDYATKDAPQMDMVWQMVDKLLGRSRSK